MNRQYNREGQENNDLQTVHRKLMIEQYEPSQEG